MGSYTRSLILITFCLALLIPVNANAQRDPCENITTPPDQISNLRAEQIGRLSTLLTWTMDFNRQNEAITHFVIERSEDGRNFTEYDIIRRVIEESRVDKTTKNNSFSYLDETAISRSTMYYKVKAGTDSLCYSELSNVASTSIKLRVGFTLVATGILVEDRTPTPTIPPPSRFLLGVFIDLLNFDFFKAFAEIGSEPLVTTGQDPQLESYLFALTPIPVPNQYLGFPCNDSLGIFVKKDQSRGQSISFDVTLFDNNSSSTIISSSFLTENANRVHNEGFILSDVEALSIENYQDLFVRIDQIDGLTGNPRALEIWDIQFLVPEDQGAC